MSYSAQEDSVEAGSPVEIFDIVLGATTYRFTSGAETVTISAQNYTPLEVRREEIHISREDRAELLVMSMPSSHPFAQFYSRRVPGQRATLTIRRFHRTDIAVELITIFKGVVRSVAFTDKGGTAKLGVMPISGALTRAVPRYSYQSLCNHVLFDNWCTIDPDDFTFNGTATSVDANLFTLTGLEDDKGDGWANGGFAVFELDYRLILQQDGDELRLLLPFNDDISGESIDIFAGCDHSNVTCETKFDNIINFGGHPDVPTKNIFSTGLS